MRRFAHGDTIIEVMFSFTVLSILVVGTYMVMNRGTQIAQRSLEITLVRQQIDSQISLVRYAQANNTTAWQTIRSSKVVDSSSVLDAASFADENTRCPSVAENDLNSGRRAFYLTQNAEGNDIRLVDITDSTYAAPQVYSQVNFDGTNPQSQGLFMQIVRAETNPATGVSPGGSAAGTAYDVYVNACWDSVGTNVPSVVGTVTSIYDGNN